MLDFRRLELDRERAALESAVARLRAIEQEQARIRGANMQAQQEVRSRESAGQAAPMSEIVQLPSYRSLLAQRWAKTEQERARAVHAIEQQRARLVEARRRFEVLERCRDKARTEWESAVTREIEATAGELYLARWRRREP